MRSRSFAFSFFSLILFAAAAVGLQASEPAAVSETAPAATAPASDVSAEIEDVSKRPLKVAIYSKSMKKKRLAAIIETDELFECIPVSAADIRNGILDKCDFVLLPGGSARAQAKDMQPEGVEKLKKFVHEGNGYLGVCAGAYFPIHQGFLNGNTKSPKWARGIEQLDLELTEEGIAIFGEEYRGMQKVRYANGPVFDVNIDPDMPLKEINAQVYDGYVRCLLEKLDNDVIVNSYLRDLITTLHFLMNTSYTGVTHFQPFPHLLLLLSCAASFYFGYRVRTDGCSADKINWVNRVFNRLLRHISECFLLVAIALVCMKLMGLDV